MHCIGIAGRGRTMRSIHILCAVLTIAWGAYGLDARAQGHHTDVQNVVAAGGQHTDVQKPVVTPATPAPVTFVSGNGNDAASCVASAPCQTFRVAANLTSAGGTIYVLDSADYGPVTLSKAITIESVGAVAGILATSGV